MATKTTKKIGDSDKKPKKKEKAPSPEELLLEQEKWALVKAKQLWAAAAAARRRYDWDWLVRNLYLRGYHFARYNRASSTFVLGTRTKVRIPVNLMWAQARAIRNQVTSFRPKWEVLPEKPTEASRENAMYSGKLLDYLYEKLGMKKKLKEIIYYGLYTSVGILQFSWDPTADKGEGEVRIDVVDPFDFYVDPNATSVKDAQFVVKAVRKPLKQILTSPLYKREGIEQEIHADGRLAASEYKEFLLQSLKEIGQGQSKLDDENEYTILYEMQKKDYEEKTGLPKVGILTYTSDSIYPLRNDKTDEDDFNYEIFQADIQPLEVYAESWAKQIMPVNRVLDALESYVFEYNHLFAKGRFVIDKGSGVRSIINEHGQIIEKNPGYRVESLPIAPLPNATFNQIQNFRQYLEDIGGLHEVSLGRLPTGVKSGVGIAELRQADATSQDDLVDNLEDFLIRCANQIFKIVSKNYTTTKLAKVLGTGGRPEFFYAVGSESATAKKMEKRKDRVFGEAKLPIAIIGADQEVRVTVGSWLAYTKQARQEQLKELYRLGAIDQQTLLEHLEFGDINAIVQRTRDERLMQLRQMSSHAQKAAEERQGVDEESLAVAENELMNEGQPQPVMMTDDHEVHMATHRMALDTTKYPTIFMDHISEHISLMQSAPQSQGGIEALMSAANLGGAGGAEGGAEGAMPPMPMPPTNGEMGGPPPVIPANAGANALAEGGGIPMPPM